jgi:hypothetical protein
VAVVTVPGAPKLIPDLNSRIHDLTVALEGLVAATGDSSPDNLLEALARAHQVLARAWRDPEPNLRESSEGLAPVQ